MLWLFAVVAVGRIIPYATQDRRKFFAEMSIYSSRWPLRASFILLSRCLSVTKRNLWFTKWWMTGCEL